MNYIILFSKDLITFACGMLSSIFVARHLGPEIYGSYVFIILVLAYFQQFGRLSLVQSILPYLKNNPEHEKTIFSLGFLLNGLMGTVTAFALVSIGSYFGLFSNYSVWIYFLMSLMIFGEFFLVFITYALAHQGKYKILSAVTTIMPVMQTIGFGYLYFFTNDQKALLPYIIINAVTMSITALIGIYLVRNYINRSFMNYRNIDIKLYLKTSILFYLTEIVNFFSSKGVTTFVVSKLGTSSLAFYSIMFNHFELLRFPNNALGTMMYPELSKENNDEKQRRYIFRKVGFNFLIYIPILITAYFLYPKLVLLFYGPEYEIITHYFPFILSTGSVYLIIYPIAHYFSANGAPQYNGFILFSSVFVQIVSALYFIYIEDFTLYTAVFSQAIGFIGFSIALLLTYKYKKFNL